MYEPYFVNLLKKGQYKKKTRILQMFCEKGWGAMVRYIMKNSSTFLQFKESHVVKSLIQGKPGPVLIFAESYSVSVDLFISFFLNEKYAAVYTMYSLGYRMTRKETIDFLRISDMQNILKYISAFEMSEKNWELRLSCLLEAKTLTTYLLSHSNDSQLDKHCLHMALLKDTIAASATKTLEWFRLRNIRPDHSTLEMFTVCGGSHQVFKMLLDTIMPFHSITSTQHMFINYIFENCIKGNSVMLFHILTPWISKMGTNPMTLIYYLELAVIHFAFDVISFIQGSHQIGSLYVQNDLFIPPDWDYSNNANHSAILLKVGAQIEENNIPSVYNSAMVPGNEMLFIGLTKSPHYAADFLKQALEKAPGQVICMMNHHLQ